MKKFYIFLAIIFFTIYTDAQPTNSNISNLTDTKTVAKKSSDDKDSKSKITLPPEKANPVKVNKVMALVVIDGKLDDAMWKAAAVFKDFIQTGPGDNIAPSKPTETDRKSTRLNSSHG